MEKKYKLTEETISINGKTLYRIEALMTFGDVKKGDKGGFVENEENLSQRNDCWVYNDAFVCENAKVCGNARVEGYAIVCGNAEVYDNAKVCGMTKIYGNARVYDNARVYGNAKVYGVTWVFNNAQVHGNAAVYDCAVVCDDAEIYDNTMVYGYAVVCGKAEIRGNAEIASNSDYIIFKNWWSSGRHFTWTRSNDMWKVGCFYGTGKELIEKAYRDSNESGKEYEKIVKYVESIIKFQ